MNQVGVSKSRNRNKLPKLPLWLRLWDALIRRAHSLFRPRSPLRRVWDFISWHVGFLFFLCAQAGIWTWESLRNVVGFLAWIFVDVVAGTIVGYTRTLLTAGWPRRLMRELVYALPLLVGLAAAGWAMSATFQSNRTLRRMFEYDKSGQFALMRKDYATAEVCYRRLSDWDRELPEYRMGLALACDGLEQSDRATNLLTELAPLTKEGYAPAHYLMAERLVRGVQKMDDAPKQAEEHLLWAVRAGKPMPEAQGLLGQIYLTRGLHKEAEAVLIKAVATQPHIHLYLARAYAKQNRTGEAMEHAEHAKTFFRREATANLDNHLARFLWAQAATIREDYAEAEAALVLGLSSTRPDEYKQHLANVYVAWADSAGRANPPDLAARLSRLEYALRVDPKNNGALNRLDDLISTKGQDAEKVRTMLRGFLTKGVALGSAHMVLGIDAWKRGQPEEAMNHLEQAAKLAPDLPAVEHNLALVMLRRPNPDLQRALQLVENSMKNSSPEVAQVIRGTRGVILVKLGRYKDGVSELEAALSWPGWMYDPEIRKALAEAYQKMGMPQIAADHLRILASKPKN